MLPGPESEEWKILLYVARSAGNCVLLASEPGRRAASPKPTRVNQLAVPRTEVSAALGTLDGCCCRPMCSLVGSAEVAVVCFPNSLCIRSPIVSARPAVHCLRLGPPATSISICSNAPGIPVSMLGTGSSMTNWALQTCRRVADVTDHWTLPRSN